MSQEYKKVIDPIDRDLLESELNKDRFIRYTNKGNNEIYSINAHNSPNTMREIGRLREISFRAAGGGTGEELDIDEYDTNGSCYQQLIVYSPDDREIIGGYRYIMLRDAMNENLQLNLSTGHYFDFSEKFIQDYVHSTMELGRSWVQPSFQPAVNPRKGIFAMDNIWDGLGALTVLNKVAYFFGKVTMYPSYNKDARNILLYFLNHYFPDRDGLLKPKKPVLIEANNQEYEKLFHQLDYEDAYKILHAYIRNLGENIPPLVNIYMKLSPTMRTFGTALNPHFGNVEETGIMVTMADIFPEKKERHINSFN
jgi:hypothetical protein